MAQVETITVSAVVSGIVGMVTGTLAFAVGARSQKNVSDRPLLRQNYQTLFEHFSALETQLAKGQPLTWGSFKVIRDEYCPPVREMELDGRANLLPAKLFETLKGVERKAVIAGSRFAHMMEEHAVPKLRSLMDARVRSPTSAQSGLRYRPFNIGLVVMDPSDLRSAEIGPEIGLGIETSLTRGKSATYYAYPETVGSGTVAELIADIAELAELPELSEAKSEVVQAREALAAARATLESRIRDPHPLHEAIADTFKDFAAFARLRRAHKS
ncbi:MULTISPECIES: hypothetical protein [unclassified Phenylobacterium]|uniref:hypothetical protein n=1 Tax=unclassified Phenylobacterium TaxID=2640670 RepID=UPI00083B4884|nr:MULTISPECIES: hypothetical protein [unclassified Phenylobacterium]